MRKFNDSFLDNGLLPANLINRTAGIAELKTMAGFRKEMHLPDVSPTTVEAVLGAMVKRGVIKRIGSARGARYIRAERKNQSNIPDDQYFTLV